MRSPTGSSMAGEPAVRGLDVVAGESRLESTMATEIAASLLSLPPERLLEGAALAVEASVDRIHYDLADGSLGKRAGSLDDLRLLVRRLPLPVDLHLMVRNPSEVIPGLRDLGVARLFAHPGSEWAEIDGLLTDFASRERVEVGLAYTLGEARAFARLLFARPPHEELLALLVPPGRSGAKPDDAVIGELLKALRHLDTRTLWIDGGVSAERVDTLLARLAGRPVSLVVGSALFRGPNPRLLVDELRRRVAER